MKRICVECEKPFETNTKAICCSKKCKLARKQRQNASYLTDQRKTDPIKSKRNLKPEKQLVESMPELNRAAPKHDGELLKSRRIHSPNIRKMPFYFQDKKMKATYYFANEQKYNNFLNRRNENNS